MFSVFASDEKCWDDIRQFDTFFLNKINPMNTNETKKKIKGQKNAAIILIILPMVGLMSYFTTNNFEITNKNGYVLVGSSVVLIICGLIGLKNSLRKEKEL